MGLQMQRIRNQAQPALVRRADHVEPGYVQLIHDIHQHAQEGRMTVMHVAVYHWKIGGIREVEAHNVYSIRRFRLRANPSVSSGCYCAFSLCLAARIMICAATSREMWAVLIARW